MSSFWPHVRPVVSSSYYWRLLGPWEQRNSWKLAAESSFCLSVCWLSVPCTQNESTVRDKCICGPTIQQFWMWKKDTFTCIFSFSPNSPHKCFFMLYHTIVLAQTQRLHYQIVLLIDLDSERDAVQRIVEMLSKLSLISTTGLRGYNWMLLAHRP